MKKEPLLLSAIYAAGIVSSIVFVVAKNETLIDAATEHMFRWGDLYRLSGVLAFRQELPPEETPEIELQGADPDSASVILIGDSFLESARGHQPLPVLLSRALPGETVFPMYAGYEPAFYDPVYCLWKNGISTGMKRVVILERVERYVAPTFLQERHGSESEFVRNAAEQEETFWTTIRRRWFSETEANYDVLLKNSVVTMPVFELWSTFRFLALGQMSDETPVYSLHPPFLFEREEVVPGPVTSFYFAHTDSLLERIADNIQELHQDLRSEYNTELVFMPVPNPYTLYHTLINNDEYDGFLPRLCDMLEERGVRTIRLYERFRGEPDQLFLPTDTHWNARGAGIAAAEAVRAIRVIRGQ